MFSSQAAHFQIKLSLSIAKRSLEQSAVSLSIDKIKVCAFMMTDRETNETVIETHAFSRINLISYFFTCLNSHETFQVYRCKT